MKTKDGSLHKTWLAILFATIGALSLPAQSPPADTVWGDDAVPAGAWTGAEGGDSWNWIGANPPPFSGSLAHQSNLGPGIHHHYFANATDTLAIEPGNVLIAHVFLDPANPPREIMLGWSDGVSWSHAAYWGEDLIPWGAGGTVERRDMGALPATGTWVRLEVPASLVGMEGRTLSGMGFVLFDGRATWDHTGKASAASPPPPALPVVQVVESDGLARRWESNGGPHPGQPNPGEFVFWRNGDTSSELTVYYTPGGTTTNGADYETLPGSVTIPAGSNYAAVKLMPRTTGVDGGSVVLTVNSDANYRVGSFGSATVTMVPQAFLPDGFFTVNVFALRDTVAENSPDSGVFIVTRTQADSESLEPLTVYYRLPGSPATGCGPADTLGNAVDGADFQPVSGAVTIPAGANFAFVAITPVDDAVFKGTRSAYFTVVQNCQTPYAVADDKFGYGLPDSYLGRPSAQAVFITDNDPPPANDVVWKDDSLPDGAWPGANGGDDWNWVGSGPTPFSGSLAHQSSDSPGLHEHFFNFAADSLTLNAGDVLFTYVYLDPASPPKELMLSWCDGTSWEHRAYWGANDIDYGQAGTAAQHHVGPLPPAGQWVRLEVPASAVGLEGSSAQGMSFSMFDGMATWDATGKSISNNPPPSLSAPTNLRVTHRGDREIDLAWDENSANETGFVVEMAVIPSYQPPPDLSYSVVGTVGPNVTQFAATNLTEGTSYSFQVKAVGAGASSTHSNLASTSVTVTPRINPMGVTNSSIMLYWSGAGPASLERSTDNVNFTQIASGLRTTSYDRTEYTDSGLPPATRYYYRVRYLDTNGDSSGYGVLAPIATDGPPPAAPTNLTATVLSPTAVQLAWTRNSTNEISFQADRSTDGASFNFLATVAANSVQYTDNTVSAGTTYYYRVRATLTPGRTVSDYSNIASTATPPLDTTPPSVTSFAVVGDNGRTVTFALTFSEPVTGVITADNTPFRITTSGSATALIGSVGGRDASYTIGLDYQGSGTVTLALDPRTWSNVRDSSQNAYAGDGVTSATFSISPPG